jgi:hypothetical protein
MFRFASIAHPTEYAYQYDTSAYNFNAAVSYHFMQYQTYNDGLCQHSGEWPITREFMADYMASFAEALLAQPEHDCWNSFAHEFQHVPSVVDIEFCAAVRFKAQKPGAAYKRQYYSLQERKLSSAPAKEFDKRYQRVEEWHDGTPEAVYRMLRGEETVRDLQRFATAYAMRLWFMVQPDQYMTLESMFLEWTKDSGEARTMRYAYEACLHLAQSYQLREEARCELGNAKRRLEPEVKAEEVA